ncbi:hypothetical protein CDAR_74951 [Caerostris darwini]|uniref:Uncharacterized protein n=1 Tax=Caerostris darwini TaxID=1538125 RepID=A0AAV4P2V6_9ARAC|nr:hypothetical protein CDAR_74951 [Caerostris darwini]
MKNKQKKKHCQGKQRRRRRCIFILRITSGIIRGCSQALQHVISPLPPYEALAISGIDRLISPSTHESILSSASVWQPDVLSYGITSRLYKSLTRTGSCHYLISKLDAENVSNLTEFVVSGSLNTHPGAESRNLTGVIRTYTLQSTPLSVTKLLSPKINST